MEITHGMMVFHYSNWGKIPGFNLGVFVLIITTETEAHDKQQGFDAGANAYLVKPIQPDEMLAQIKLLIGEP